MTKLSRPGAMLQAGAVEVLGEHRSATRYYHVVERGASDICRQAVATRRSFKRNCRSHRKAANIVNPPATANCGLVDAREPGVGVLRPLGGDGLCVGMHARRADPHARSRAHG